MTQVWPNCVFRSLFSLFFFVSAAAVIHLSPTEMAAQELTADDLFDPTRLLEIEIEIPEQDWQALCKQSRGGRQGGFAAIFSQTNESPFTYFKGDIKINGVSIPSVGIRKKGFIGSLDETRPSLKVKFAEYVDQLPVDGLDRLTLNNNKQDTALVSQFLSYKIFNDAGIHAPRCSFCKVTVNGEYLGIYSHVESVKKPFLKARYGNDSGNLFEGTLADFYPKSLAKLESKFGVKAIKDADAMRLAELLAADDDLPMDEVNRLLDVDNFLKFWAVESLLGFWDGYTQNQNNFFVYDNPANGQFYFMPWGADSCFTKGGGPFRRFGDRQAESVKAEAMLPNRLYQVDEIPNRYKSTMLEVLDKAWREKELLAEVDRIEKLTAGQLHPGQETNDQAGWGRPSLTMDGVRDFIRSRRKQILAELNQWPAEVPDQPRKPFYTVQVGSASGVLDTIWSDNTSSDAGGTVKEFKLELYEESIANKGWSVTAKPMQAFGFRGSRAREWDPPATIEIRGTHGKDGEPIALTMMIPREALAEKSNEPIPVSGSLSLGNQRGFGFGPPRQMLNGTLSLTETGTENGDKIQGKFDISIVELHGGMMDRMRGRGGQRR